MIYEKLISYLEKKDAWKVDINQNTEISREANRKVYWLIFCFSTLYFFVSMIVFAFIYFLHFLLEYLFDSITINDMFWLFYGLLFGLTFSFFVNSIPSIHDSEIPIDIFRSFYHYFTYYLAFLSVVTIWAGSIMVFINTVYF